MRKLLSLWGSGASAEDQPQEETAEEKAAREQREAEAREREEGEGDEDDDEDDDEATKAEVAKLSPKARRAIVRAAHARVHAIVDAGGPTRVASSLRLALGTTLGTKAAIALVGTLPEASASAPAPAGGKLGLQADQHGRRQPALGPAGAPTGPKGEEAEAEAMARSIVGAAAK
jgi:hypothetical protein